MLNTYQELLQQASMTLIALVCMSFVALSIGLERWFFVWQFKKRLHQTQVKILEQLKQGEHTMAQAFNASMPAHPATILFELLLSPGVIPIAQIKRLQSQIMRQVRQRLWILGSIGALAPFVGLFGTVLGVMQAFTAMGAAGTGGFQVVAAGISEALITTAAGIFVGIESVLLFNYLQVYVASCAASLRDSLEEISETLCATSHKPNSLIGSERPSGHQA